MRFARNHTAQTYWWQGSILAQMLVRKIYCFEYQRENSRALFFHFKHRRACAAAQFETIRHDHIKQPIHTYCHSCIPSNHKYGYTVDHQLSAVNMASNATQKQCTSIGAVRLRLLKLQPKVQCACNESDLL